MIKFPLFSQGMLYRRIQMQYTILRGFSRPIKIIKNGEIRFPTLRVVFTDKATNQEKWEIMTRDAALKFAKENETDLILITAKSDPPVCKIDDSGKTIIRKRKKEAAPKSKPVKEVFFTSVIGDHDLEIKVKRVKQFLVDKHKVKVAVTTKPQLHRKNPLALEETVLKILKMIENDVSTINQTAPVDPHRRDFTLNPKSSNT